MPFSYCALRELNNPQEVYLISTYGDAHAYFHAHPCHGDARVH